MDISNPALLVARIAKTRLSSFVFNVQYDLKFLIE